ncbi:MULTISPECIES: hypothetical protein [Chromobacterium]|uniref:hypothetical protein n=1 Tax=Chromobacterium TaxID=535 RepID=UPI0005BBDA67|nr:MULTISPECIES: hypothetical protein [Chromobacterium]QOZ83611.1 hypothetical protein DXT74_11330 [Chromobacterium sp. Rain0013]WON83728.1 hypothetical protein OK026_21815 [Chromobacterium haemolyticum]
MSNLLLLSNDAGRQVFITVVGVPMPDGVLANYITNTANQPQTFDNRLYAWESSANQVPWDKAPVGQAALLSDSSTSTRVLNFDYEPKGYVIAYAVAGAAQAVCSSVYLPAGEQDNPQAWAYDSVSLQTVYVDSNVLQLKYKVLTAYQPKAAGNWVGIWQGSTVPYSGDPIRSLPVPRDDDSGYLAIDGLKLTINTSYAVGYFMQALPQGRTSLAATTTFTIGAYQGEKT